MTETVFDNTNNSLIRDLENLVNMIEDIFSGEGFETKYFMNEYKKDVGEHFVAEVAPETLKNTIGVFK